MLYELAWVYVRLGDVERAQRALEVLAIADPNSQNIADGQLAPRRPDAPRRPVRARRSRSTRASAPRYDPMRAKVDAFLGSIHDDPAVYYDKLSAGAARSLDNNAAPPAARRADGRARPEDGPLAFAVIDDVNRVPRSHQADRTS